MTIFIKSNASIARYSGTVRGMRLHNRLISDKLIEVDDRDISACIRTVSSGMFARSYVKRLMTILTCKANLISCIGFMKAFCGTKRISLIFGCYQKLHSTVLASFWIPGFDSRRRVATFAAIFLSIVVSGNLFFTSHANIHDEDVNKNSLTSHPLKRY